MTAPHPAVLASDIPESAPVEAPPPVSWRAAYSTVEELAWLNSLAERHQWTLLATLRTIYPLRSWGGTGMAVDSEAVMEHLNKLLKGRVR